MKTLNDILTQAGVQAEVHADTAMVVTNITADSRKVSAGSLFVAVRGTKSDGHDFLAQVRDAGAAACIISDVSRVVDGLPFILVQDTASALGKCAHAFYGSPSEHLQLIGITGTNGKTTCATLTYHMLRSLGYACGLISTVENKINDTIIPSTHTTPDPVALNALLADMVAAGCAYACMEVSSHAVDQKRIAGLQFRGAVFTNITHDHLDYHGTFEKYIAAKKAFFDGLPKTAFALVNADDKRGEVMLQNCKAKHAYFSVRGPADFTARIIENAITGLVLQLDGTELHTHLPGAFNASNITTVYGICRLLGLEKQEVLTALSKQLPVEGRFDVVYSPADKLAGIVDYAHTPDAVEKLLSTVRSMLKKDQQLISVVGCGGDRDKAKRPVMAEVAIKFSDRSIFTSDNPRSEQPDAIIHEMEKGVPADMRAKYLSITDRKEAIKTAVMLAKKGDVICVAGKGHEKYQEINGVKYPFDDKQVLLETFKTLSR
ncbi:MAG: UDP-N-acetylmuramoyl-L-alanyl-D-glutamate--2,6-diaminopimelate ligase [Chitinophagales bacterium]